MKMPKVGALVRVEWVDIVGGINEPLSRVVPQSCWSIGVLIRLERDFIVLASSQFIDDGKDPTGDYTAIVRGCITSIKRK